MKVSREGLEASDQRLTEECNRHDQDGEEKKGKEDGCQSASAPEQLLQPAVCGVASNSNGQSPSDHGEEGTQNKEAGYSKKDDKGEVNENFGSATQVRFVGRRLARGHVRFSFADQDGPLRSVDHPGPKSYLLVLPAGDVPIASICDVAVRRLLVSFEDLTPDNWQNF
jgi:hypothetical protein